MGWIGSFFGPSEKTQKVEVEPGEEAEQLNRIRLKETEDALELKSLADFLETPEVTTQLSSNAKDMLGRIIKEGRVPDLTLDRFLELAGTGVGSLLEEVVEPRIRNQAALSGISRSGATEEAIGKAGAELLFPILQGLPQAASTLQNVQLRGLESGFQAADTPRQLQQAEFLRKQGIVVPLVTGLPFNPGSTTSRFENPFDVFLRRDAQVASNAGSWASLGAGVGGMGI